MYYNKNVKHSNIFCLRFHKIYLIKYVLYRRLKIADIKKIYSIYKKEYYVCFCRIKKTVLYLEFIKTTKNKAFI